jgi:acyl transferase domain-containing protein
VPWPRTQQGIRRASVNSFGFGGTNAHVVLDDVASYLQQTTHMKGALEILNTVRTSSSSFPRLMFLHAADEDGCLRQATLLSRFIREFQGCTESTLDNLVYTLNTRRTKLPWKSYYTVEARADLRDIEIKLAKPIRRDVSTPNVAFVFTGQGAQWLGMGRELFDWPAFSWSVSRSQTQLEKLGCYWSLKGMCIPSSMRSYS